VFLRLSIVISRPFLTIDCRFLQLDYCLRPIITGKEPIDKIHRPGAKILKVYHHLTEEDALALTKMPQNVEGLMRWNASLRNIATLVRNHTTGDLQTYVTVSYSEFCFALPSYCC